MTILINIHVNQIWSAQNPLGLSYNLAFSKRSFVGTTHKCSSITPPWVGWVFFKARVRLATVVGYLTLCPWPSYG